MTDFKKPIRFTIDKTPAHLIGPRLDGTFLIERYEHPDIIIVDKEGRGLSLFSVSPIIENVPERITRWVVVTPHIGYENKEEAINVAAHYEGKHCAVVKLVLEVGERP